MIMAVIGQKVDIYLYCNKIMETIVLVTGSYRRLCTHEFRFINNPVGTIDFFGIKVAYV